MSEAIRWYLLARLYESGIVCLQSCSRKLYSLEAYLQLMAIEDLVGVIAAAVSQEGVHDLPDPT